MPRRRVVQRLGGVDPHAVEMIFGDPVAQVGEEKLSDQRRIVLVEIHRPAPIRRMPSGEIPLSKLGQDFLAHSAQMIVNDIENHSEADAMGFIDEMAKAVRPAVQVTWSEQVRAVVAPPEAARKLSDGHEFDRSKTEVREFSEFAAGSVPSARLSEGADVHFVERLPGDRDAAPARIAPGEVVRIDDFRRSLRS